MTSEEDLDRAQARRELRWIFGGLLIAAAAVVTAPWSLGVLEQLDVLSASFVAITVGAVIFWTRRRRGPGWTSLRVLSALAVVVLFAPAALVAGCAASHCFN